VDDVVFLPDIRNHKQYFQYAGGANAKHGAVQGGRYGDENR
jgi:hypothetical protein